jgi:DNA polymerase III delta prime subunit
LPKALIKTGDGSGTIPDGFAIDLASKKWYLVEAELLHHNVWGHIAPQVSKQAIASLQPLSKRIIEDLAVTQYQNDETTKEKFDEQCIKEIDVRKILAEILNKEPVIGIPIDSVSNDLKEWARTLKYNVKLWTITKYVDFNDKDVIVYEFPEEFKPTLDTEEEQEKVEQVNELARYDVSISDLIDAKILEVGLKLKMQYKPRQGNKRTYEAEILEDGSMSLLDQVYSSPSYAALAGIQDAGSERKTVNGWTSWKNKDGKTLAELREELLMNK